MSQTVNVYQAGYSSSGSWSLALFTMTKASSEIWGHNPLKAQRHVPSMPSQGLFGAFHCADASWQNFSGSIFFDVPYFGNWKMEKKNSKKMMIMIYYDILWYIMIYYDIFWYILIVYYCDDDNLILIVIMVILRTWRPIHRTEAFGGWSPEVFLRKSWHRPWGHVVATVIAERKQTPSHDTEECWVMLSPI